jgi:hypothetical protein
LRSCHFQSGPAVFDHPVAAERVRDDLSLAKHVCAVSVIGVVMRKNHVTDAVVAPLGDKLGHLPRLAWERQRIDDNGAFGGQHSASGHLRIQATGENKNIVRDTLSLH